MPRVDAISTLTHRTRLSGDESLKTVSRLPPVYATIEHEQTAKSRTPQPARKRPELGQCPAARAGRRERAPAGRSGWADLGQ